MSLVQMRWIDKLIARTIVVNLKHDETIRGVLVGTYRDCIVLQHALHLGTLNGTKLEVPVDGEAIIPRENIAWIQTLAGGRED